MNKIPNCDCITWASSDLNAILIGNGHNPKCEKYQPHDGAIDLLKRLVDGIDYWASQEDGVPDELWDAYREAVFIVKGKMLDDKGE